MINIFFASFLLWGQLVFGSPAELPRRAACNADNCLRELQHTSVLASSFCSKYLGTATDSLGVTVTTTYSDLSITELAKRTTATTFYPTSCTEATTAISSGCSCLLALPTVASTVTVTANAIPTQCNADNNYGLISNGADIEDGPGQAQHYYLYSESVRGGCCARCFATPNCVIFAEFDSPSNPYPIECYIWEVYTSPTSTQNSMCPFGTLPVALLSPTNSAVADSGVGPCGLGTFY